MMKIAVPYENGNVNQHFGHSEEFKFYTVEEDKVLESEVKDTAGASHGAIADFLHEQDVDVVICGGMGGGMIAKLQGYGIEIFPGVTGDVDEAVRGYLDGTLEGSEEFEACQCDHDHDHHHMS